MQPIGMKVDHIEGTRVPANSFQHQGMQREGIGVRRVQADRPVAYGYKLGLSD
jgi:hypothetical protein